jgi:hypothetical protein
MIHESYEHNALGWGWALDWQVWACRLSHMLGLIVVLLLLLVLGWLA